MRGGRRRFLEASDSLRLRAIGGFLAFFCGSGMLRSVVDQGGEGQKGGFLGQPLRGGGWGLGERGGRGGAQGKSTNDILLKPSGFLWIWGRKKEVREWAKGAGLVTVLTGELKRVERENAERSKGEDAGSFKRLQTEEKFLGEGVRRGRSGSVKWRRKGRHLLTL